MRSVSHFACDEPSFVDFELTWKVHMLNLFNVPSDAADEFPHENTLLVRRKTMWNILDRVRWHTTNDAWHSVHIARRKCAAYLDTASTWYIYYPKIRLLVNTKTWDRKELSSSLPIGRHRQPLGSLSSFFLLKMFSSSDWSNRRPAFHRQETVRRWMKTVWFIRPFDCRALCSWLTIWLIYDFSSHFSSVCSDHSRKLVTQRISPHQTNLQEHDDAFRYGLADERSNCHSDWWTSQFVSQIGSGRWSEELRTIFGFRRRYNRTTLQCDLHRTGTVW